MDDVKIFCLIMLALSFSLPRIPSAFADLEYVSPTQRKLLQKTFLTSSFKVSAKVQGKWKCDMFGMRTHLQVQRDMELYDWSQGEKPNLWTNQGAQPVSAYKVSHGTLTGTHDRFEDQVKYTDDGRLISQLSVVTPNRMVVAYSLCRRVDELASSTAAE